MTDPSPLREWVLLALEQVIDPETGVDVVHMRLIEDLAADEQGHVSYTFRPSSPFCPLGFTLAQMIHKAVATTQGVASQRMTVAGHMQAEVLTQLINAAR